MFIPRIDVQYSISAEEGLASEESARDELEARGVLSLVAVAGSELLVVAELGV